MAGRPPPEMEAAAKKLVALYGPGTPELNAYALAGQFHSGALRCLTMVHQPSGGFEMDIGPGIVCLAFTCELYLKALHLMRNGKAPKGHKLHVLLQNLPADAQAFIAGRYAFRNGRDLAAFRADVLTFSDAFSEWRYVYEGPQGVHLELGRLLHFTSALYEAIQHERPQWPYPNSERYTAAAMPRVPAAGPAA